MRLINTRQDREIWMFESSEDMERFTDPNAWDHDKMNHSKGFVGEDIPTWEALQARLKRDWAEGMYILQQYIDKIESQKIPELKSHKRQTNFNMDDGDEVDLERLYAGQAFWRKSEREEKEGPTEVTIVTDTTTVWHKSAEDVLWRGAAAIALTKILEEKGYRVELWVVNGTRLYAGESKPVMTACCLKRTSDPLDTSTLINTVSGWFYRTLTFSMLLTICKTRGKQPSGGLGSCYTPTQDDLDHITPDQLRIYSAGVYSFNGAFDMIVHELQKFSLKEQPEG